PMEEAIRPKAVTDVFEAEPRPDAAHIDFTQLCERKNAAVVYAATYLHAPAERDATIQIGSDDWARVWLNGKAVLERRVSIPAFPAQATVPIHLNAGWNRLLVKVVQATGPWEMYFDLAEPSGADVAVSSEKD